VAEPNVRTTRPATAPASAPSAATPSAATPTAATPTAAATGAVPATAASGAAATPSPTPPGAAPKPSDPVAGTTGLVAATPSAKAAAPAPDSPARDRRRAGSGQATAAPAAGSSGRSGPATSAPASSTPADPVASEAPAAPAGPSAQDLVWARVQEARNVKRPHTLELIRAMATDVVEIHGDRAFGDDPAVVAGFARIPGFPFVFVGHQKGAEVEENIRRNFGMAHPEGYRKAMRAFRLAERFKLPVVTFVDTSGAFPGPASEERGVAEAIARSIMTMMGLRTPIVAIITGEGGSGGALGIAASDVVLALENAVYAVISPEGCASILWRDSTAAPRAALAMRMSATDQLGLGVVDEVVAEPAGGAQEDPTGLAATLAGRIAFHLGRLTALPDDELVERRYQRYRAMGAFVTVERPPVVPPRKPDLVGRMRDFIGDVQRATIGGPEPAGPARELDVDDLDAPLREEL